MSDPILLEECSFYSTYRQPIVPSPAKHATDRPQCKHAEETIE